MRAALSVLSQSRLIIQAEFERKRDCQQSKNWLVYLILQQVGYCFVRCQKLHWQTHKKFCKQLAKEYEEILATKEAEEKLNQEMKKKGENMTVAVNGKAEENLNTENPKTENDQKADTQLHVAVNGTIKAEPTDNQASGVLEEKT